MAQLVNNPPATRETRVPSLGQEDPLERGEATLSSIPAWRIPWGHKESDTTERLSLHLPYNAVSVSTVQKNESAVCRHNPPPF